MIAFGTSSFSPKKVFVLTSLNPPRMVLPKDLALRNLRRDLDACGSGEWHLDSFEPGNGGAEMLGTVSHPFDVKDGGRVPGK